METQEATTETIRIAGITVKYLLEGGASQGRAGIFEFTVEPGAKVPPPHSHSASDEFVYVVEGTLRYSVDGETRDLGPGESMHSPRGSVHQFSNPHSQRARVLSINTPDIGIGYFRDVASLFSAGGPPDASKLGRIMDAYGLVLARPTA
jgi:quercetin dioxygenase-like cupin family protein